MKTERKNVSVEMSCSFLRNLRPKLIGLLVISFAIGFICDGGCFDILEHPFTIFIVAGAIATVLVILDQRR